MEWLGYRIETESIGVVLLGAAVLAGIIALIYRFWRFLLRSPAAIGRRMQDNKRRRGYRALSQGMVAIAAGDGPEAARWARRAEGLLSDPPLTLLLSAQTAQLQGDESAARRYFETMLENEETRFLGLRGLVSQAMKEGNRAAALEYLRQAKELRPKTPWVLTNLFELSRHEGNYLEAETALKASQKTGILPPMEVEVKRAGLSLARALAAEEDGDTAAALRLAKDAKKQRNGWVAPVLAVARLALAVGKPRDAQKAIEQAWSSTPHPEMVTLYRALKHDASALEQVKRITKLTNTAQRLPESRMANAEAALDAELWGEARRHLQPLLDADPSRRTCRLMARLEESEHGNREGAREWLERSFTASADPAWVCGECGARHSEWTHDCAVCGAFDSIDWRLPRVMEVRRAGPPQQIESMAEPHEEAEIA